MHSSVHNLGMCWMRIPCQPIKMAEGIESRRRPGEEISHSNKVECTSCMAGEEAMTDTYNATVC